jgi:hypothetical protein
MATLTLTLDQLVARTQLDILDAGGQGRQVVMGSTALTTTGATSMTLTDATGVNITDLIEFGSELVLVTAKSDDVVPILTVSRGYFNTVAAAHAAADVGHLNPIYPKRKIAEAIRRSFARMESLGVPLVVTDTFSRAEGYSYVQLPSYVREVLEVLYWGLDGRLWPLGGWTFQNNLPVAKFPTGNVLNAPRLLEDADEIEVTFRKPYRWSTYPDDPVGASTIEVPEGAEDLPALYAAAWLSSSREMSRVEIDRSEEWNQTAMTGQGQSAALVRAKWQEFYRALDEARRLNHIPQTIRYRPRPKL